ncbi:MAG: rhaS 3 [Firmicutes bacterium]|nr:rhaS 3 [Bacillota bacterium]
MESNKLNYSIRYYRFHDIPGLEIFRGIADTRFVARHVHDLFCITIAESGVRVCETKKDKYSLTPGMIFISNRGEAHSASVPKDHTYSCYSMRFDTKLLHSLLSHIGCSKPDSIHFGTPLLCDRKLYQKLWQLHITFNEPLSILTKEYQLLDAFSRIVTGYTEVMPPAFGNEKKPVQTACEYLQDCFADNISVEQLASLVALSPFHFCRVFEKEVGVPPHVYQLDIRLNRAAQMLSQGKQISSVAIETGFFDQSHFHKAFKRKFGITPKCYSK